MAIYMDHAATTIVSPPAAEAALHAMTQAYGNPSSRHRLGSEAAAALAEHRAQIAAALSCQAEEVMFTSGGTEGDNWAIAIAAHANRRVGRHIITTAVEHSAVLEPIRALEQQGYEVTYLAPDKSGHISLPQLESALRSDTILLSIMLVNNENGCIFPVKEASQLLKQKAPQVLLHSDAVQAFLKIPVSPKELGVDLLTVSAHKIGGMKGCGALYVRKGLAIQPLILGGGQERGFRSGTEATPQLAAFAAACRLGSEMLSAHFDQLTDLKAYALRTLQECVPDLVIVSEGDAPHICAIALPGYPSEMLVRALSDRDIFVSSGSACHKGKASHVFAAMKLPPKVSRSILRLSFSPENRKEDIDALCDAFLDIRSTYVPARS